nr:hypothetical protein [Pseudomonas sp.]
MRLLIVTDAWQPQVNGVVTSLRALERDRRACAQWAREQAWRASAQEFLALQVRLTDLPVSEEPGYGSG